MGTLVVFYICQAPDQWIILFEFVQLEGVRDGYGTAIAVGGV